MAAFSLITDSSNWWHKARELGNVNKPWRFSICCRPNLCPKHCTAHSNSTSYSYRTVWLSDQTRVLLGLSGSWQVKGENTEKRNWSELKAWFEVRNKPKRERVSWILPYGDIVCVWITSLHDFSGYDDVSSCNGAVSLILLSFPIHRIRSFPSTWIRL